MTKSLREFKNADQRRKFLESKLGVNLENIKNYNFEETKVLGRNIENLIGAIQIPLGVAGPLLLRSTNHELRTHYIPLATTEGALVASVSRGCKAITNSGGCEIIIEDVGMSRAPVFKTRGIQHSKEVKNWIEKNFELLAKETEKSSSHLKLLKILTTFVGTNLFVRFSYNTQDAMGMNMVTIATEKATDLIESKTKAECISLSGNYEVDKKPSWLNFIEGRGKKAWAEVILPKKIVKEVLKATPEEIAEVVYRKCLLGSIMAGSLGFNAHFANIAAAIFAATGQDLGQVSEASLGVTTAEVLKDGSLHFSVYLPSLEVGTVGGGTNLPTQLEALSILGVSGKGNVLKFAEVVAAAVLAGELSLIASQAEGTLAKAHIKLGRKGGK